METTDLGVIIKTKDAQSYLRQYVQNISPIRRTIAAQILPLMIEALGVNLGATFWTLAQDQNTNVVSRTVGQLDAVMRELKEPRRGELLELLQTIKAFQKPVQEYKARQLANASNVETSRVLESLGSTKSGTAQTITKTQFRGTILGKSRELIIRARKALTLG